MKRTLIIPVLAILAGCATTQQATDALQKGFVGRDLDAFVLRYGAPLQRHQLNSGGSIYVWSSEVQSYDLPSTTTIQGTTSPYGFSGSAVTTGGGVVNVFCEVQIVTAPNGTITSIAPTRDTIGRWTTSRCAEVFNE